MMPTQPLDGWRQKLLNLLNFGIQQDSGIGAIASFTILGHPGLIDFYIKTLVVKDITLLILLGGHDWWRVL